MAGQLFSRCIGARLGDDEAVGSLLLCKEFASAPFDVCVRHRVNHLDVSFDLQFLFVACELSQYSDSVGPLVGEFVGEALQGGSSRSESQVIGQDSSEGSTRERSKFCLNFLSRGLRQSAGSYGEGGWFAGIGVHRSCILAVASLIFSC